MRNPVGISGLQAGEDVNTVSGSDMSTVDMSGVKTNLSTMVEKSLSTVDKTNVSTVVKESTILGNSSGTKPSSSWSRIHEAMSQYATAVDDDIVDRLLNACRRNAAECTDDEIIHFVHQKGAMVPIKEARIYNPIGFLLTAVPKCFAGEAFRLYREAKAKRREEETAAEARRQSELAAWRREQEAQLADPNVPEDDKRMIREWLHLEDAASF